MKANAKREPLERERAAAMERLRLVLPVGTTVFTILRSVSRSGMSREIDVVIWDSEFGTPVIVSWLVGWALDYPMGKTRNTVVVKGTGMDMAFSLVCSIARRLHGSDHALKHGPL
jgi:hypothetical protein